MDKFFQPSDNGERYELYCPKSMPSASTFLWNRKMLLQLNCRGYAVGQHMQPEPSKYSHAPILEHKTFMQPEQARYAHHPGRFVYVQDVLTEELFSAPYEPVRADLDSFVFSAGRTDTRWTVRKGDIEIQMSVRLPLEDVAELWKIEVINHSKQRRFIKLFPCFSIGYMSWMNQSASYSSDVGGVVAKSVTPYQKLEDYPHIKTLKDCTVFLHDKAPTAWETNRDEFEGEGGIQNPDAISDGGLKNGEATYETPIAALEYQVELAAEETQEFRFVFAPVRNLDEAAALKEKFLCVNGFDNAQGEVDEFLEQSRGCISISTPDKDLDNFVNHWLDRQVFYHGDANRLTTDPQTRNYLQDAMGMVYIEPSHTRAAILKTLSQQKYDGSLPEGVVLSNGGELKYINQIPHTDHCVWLPIALQAYLDETNDYALLDEVVDCGKYSQSVLERTNRAMQWLIDNRDHRGLSFIAQGDWCDPLNMVGHEGKGISGWLTIATVYVLKLWSEISKKAGANAVSAQMQEAAKNFTNAAQEHLWDGEWFARGISDNGTNLGVQADEEGKIWLNPQSWALMSGVASPEQETKIKASMKAHLETPYGAMVLAPSYTHMHEHIGRVTQKHPGTSENGAVYNHAATFGIYAFYAQNEIDAAFNELVKMIPSTKDENSVRRGQLPVFVPNYYRGAVKQFPKTAGRSSQLFNTGACSWLYRIIVEQLMGLRGTPEGLLIAPQIPSDWDQAQIKRRFRGASFNIDIQRVKTVSAIAVSIDGQHIEGGLITDIKENGIYDVLVLIPQTQSPTA